MVKKGGLLTRVEARIIFLLSSTGQKGSLNVNALYKSCTMIIKFLAKTLKHKR
jgi:hypothetical protein